MADAVSLLLLGRSADHRLLGFEGSTNKIIFRCFLSLRCLVPSRHWQWLIGGLV